MSARELRHILAPEVWRSELMDLTYATTIPTSVLKNRLYKSLNRYHVYHLLFNFASCAVESLQFLDGCRAPFHVIELGVSVVLRSKLTCS